MLPKALREGKADVRTETKDGGTVSDLHSILLLLGAFRFTNGSYYTAFTAKMTVK